MTTYHCAWAVDVDRFSDAKLTRDVIPGMLLDGRRPTVAELRAMCADARRRGLVVFPACDNTNPDGTCAGHETSAPARPSDPSRTSGAGNASGPVACGENGAPSGDDDVRPVKPDWSALADLVEGARSRRGFTSEQIEYLESAIGIAWAKAYGKGRAER